MNQDASLKEKIFSVQNDREFNALALEVFHFQVQHTDVYREFAQGLKIVPSTIDSVEKIPFLPVEFFKSREVICQGMQAAMIFESSGTTGSSASRHFVADLDLYRKSLLGGFDHFYGTISDYCILALLPSYLERKNASLVFMVNEWMNASGHDQNGFFLDDFRSLADTLLLLEKQQQKTLLIGVSFALLDFAAQFPMNLKHTVIMETGGMKGRRKELIREELHRSLADAFGTGRIHSEYGMTELLSQSYSQGNGLFRCPPWMKISIGDIRDYSSLAGENKTGLINIIDLANLNSCSFISTQDIGRKNTDGTFEVLGRYDQSELRGCNLLVD